MLNNTYISIKAFSRGFLKYQQTENGGKSGYYTNKVFNVAISPRNSGSCPVILQLLNIL